MPKPTPKFKSRHNYTIFADQVRGLLLLLSASSRKYLFQLMKEVMSWSSLIKYPELDHIKNKIHTF